jgi:hypothetical protein
MDPIRLEFGLDKVTSTVRDVLQTSLLFPLGCIRYGEYELAGITKKIARFIIKEEIEF